MKKNKDINVYRKRQFRVEKLLTLYSDFHINYWVLVISLIGIYIGIDLMNIFNIDFLYTVGCLLFIYLGFGMFYLFAGIFYLILFSLKKYYFNKVRFLFNEELKGNNKRIVRICDKE